MIPCAGAEHNGNVQQLRELHAFSGNGPIFLSAYDEHSYFRSRRGNFGILLGIRVPASIELYPQKAQLVACRAAYFRRVFANAGCENKCVKTTERCSHCAYTRNEPVDKNIEGKLRTFVASLKCAENVAHVAGYTRDAQQARLVIESVVERAGG